MLNSMKSFSCAVQFPCPSTKFDYKKRGKDWILGASKDAKSQSPINLDLKKAQLSKANKICFLNYNKQLKGPLYVSNNNYSAVIQIPPTEDGTEAGICGGGLKSLYKCRQLHFHWGSKKRSGSEHTINSTRYDAELHIVHMNCVYKSIAEAIQQPDGLAVLGILMQRVRCADFEPRAIAKISLELYKIKKSGSKTQLKSTFSMRDFFTDLNMQEFFTYQGSLTTPPCAETVTWIVFFKPMKISKIYLQHFWTLEDRTGNPLLNNFRHLQKLNQRPLYFRTKKKSLRKKLKKQQLK